MPRIDLLSLPWIEPTAGVRFKSADRDGHRVRLVEFASDFSEAEWCRDAHIGYVLTGCLEILLAGGAEVLSAGDALMIGAGELHRARVVEGPVRLFLVEAVETTGKP
jgi:quercetin dioxygenase-like cupin family protein